MKAKTVKRGTGHYCRCARPHVFYSVCLNCLRFISEAKLERVLSGTAYRRMIKNRKRRKDLYDR